MTSQIIPTNPTAGSASTSSVRENFRIADEEITKLQRANIDAQELTGGPVLYSVTYPQPEANLEYVDGMRIAARVNVTNVDGSLTVLSLRVNGGADVRLKSLEGLDLAAGDLVVGQYYEFILNAPGGGATPYFACVNINKNFKEVSVEGITVTSPALGNTAGDETIQAEFRAANANASYLKIQDERWEDGSEWTSASKLLQFGIDAEDHAYIASSTEGSGHRGIEIGTHDGAGAREKFFVGDADGGVGLYYNNAKKLETTDDGVVITSGNTDVDVQPQLLLRSNEPRSDGNQLGGITFQGSFDDGTPRAYGFLRVESPVSTTGDEEGRFRFFVRKTGNLFKNVLNLASNGIDVDGGVFADYINLNGNNPLDTEAVNTGDVLCKRIQLDDPTSTYDDIFQIFTEAGTSGGAATTGSMVLKAGDNNDDKIIFRMGNYPNPNVDILTATATSIRIPATKRLQFGTESSGYLEIFENSLGDATISQVGDGSLVLKGQNGYLKSDTKDVASWGALDISLKYNGLNRLTTESFGTTTTGISKAANFQCDTTQLTDDTTWSVFARDGGSNVLYVQQGGTSSEIASFRKGALNASGGTEVLGVKANGIVVNGTIQGQHVANNGDAGVTATVSNPTNFTIRNGLITAVS